MCTCYDYCVHRSHDIVVQVLISYVPPQAIWIDDEMGVAVLTLLIINHTPILCRYITCITLGLTLGQVLLTLTTVIPSYLTQAAGLIKV